MRLHQMISGLFLLGMSVSAAAQDYSYRVYVDADGNPGTGCNVVLTGGTVAGAERVLTAEVTGTVVTATTLASCNAGSFGAASIISGAHPVGLNLGALGADVVELSASRGELGATRSANVRLAVTAVAAGGASDVLLTTTCAPGGPAIMLGLPVSIPLLGTLGLGLLVLAVLLIGARGARRRGLAMLGALLFAGAVWAANFVSDGAISDWLGEPVAANDGIGDASLPDDGADITQFFAAFENASLFFRVDVTDLENQRPVAVDQAPTYLEDAPTQTIILTASDGDGDPLTFAIITPPGLGSLGAITPINATSASVA